MQNVERPPLHYRTTTATTTDLASTNAAAHGANVPGVIAAAPEAGLLYSCSGLQRSAVALWPLVCCLRWGRRREAS